MEFQSPTKFKKDLLNCFVSKFFVEELRNIFTEKERENYLLKHSIKKAVKSCEDPESCICHSSILKNNASKDKQKLGTFQVENILENIKMYHFHKNDMRNKKIKDSTRLFDQQQDFESSKISNQPQRRETNLTVNSQMTEIYNNKNWAPGPNLLLERQPHTCSLQHPVSLRDKILYLKKKSILDQVQLLEREVVQRTLNILSKNLRRSRADQFELSSLPLKDNNQFNHINNSDDEFYEKSITDFFKDKKSLSKAQNPDSIRSKTGIDFIYREDLM